MLDLFINKDNIATLSYSDYNRLRSLVDTNVPVTRYRFPQYVSLNLNDVKDDISEYVNTIIYPEIGKCVISEVGKYTKCIATSYEDAVLLRDMLSSIRFFDSLSIILDGCSLTITIPTKDTMGLMGDSYCAISHISIFAEIVFDRDIIHTAIIYNDRLYVNTLEHSERFKDFVKGDTLYNIYELPEHSSPMFIVYNIENYSTSDIIMIQESMENLKIITIKDDEPEIDGNRISGLEELIRLCDKYRFTMNDVSVEDDVIIIGSIGK